MLLVSKQSYQTKSYPTAAHRIMFVYAQPMHVLRGAPCRHTPLNSSDIVLQSHAWWDTRRHPCRLVPIRASSSIARLEVLFAAIVFLIQQQASYNTQFLLLALPIQPNSLLCCCQCRRRGSHDKCHSLSPPKLRTSKKEEKRTCQTKTVPSPDQQSRKKLGLGNSLAGIFMSVECSHGYHSLLFNCRNWKLLSISL